MAAERKNIFFYTLKIIVILLILTLNNIYVTYSQKVFSAYPFQYDQFQNQLNALNPSISFKNERFIQSGYNGFNQLSANIASYYLNFRYSIGKDSNYKKQILGLFLSNDKEGEYLGRFRLIGQYAYKLYFSEHTYLASGISLGFINNSLKPNPAIGGESVYATELDIGVNLNHKEKLNLGLSLNQIFNSPIRFYNGSYSRIRYISLIAGHILSLGYSTKIKTTFYYRTGFEYYNKIGINISAEFKELLSLGMTMKTRNGIMPTIGLKNIPVLKDKFSFFFSFRFPTSKYIQSGTGNFELAVNYKFN